MNNNLSANSKAFIFDYHDGKYGFNTNPNRGADTFTPFSGTEIKYIHEVMSGSRTHSYTFPNGYRPLSVFIANGNGTQNYQGAKVSYNPSTQNYEVVSYAHIDGTYNYATNTFSGTSSTASQATTHTFFGFIINEDALEDIITD